MKFTEWQSWHLNPGLCAAKVLVVCDPLHHSTLLPPWSRKEANEGIEVREWGRKNQGLGNSLGEFRKLEAQLEIGSWLGKTHDFGVTALWGQPVDRRKNTAELRRSAWDGGKCPLLKTVWNDFWTYNPHKTFFYLALNALSEAPISGPLHVWCALPNIVSSLSQLRCYLSKEAFIATLFK